MFKHCHSIVDCASTVTSTQVIPHLFKVVLELVWAVSALAEVEDLWNDVLLPVVK